MNEETDTHLLCKHIILTDVICLLSLEVVESPLILFCLFREFGFKSLVNYGFMSKITISLAESKNKRQDTGDILVHSKG